MLKIQVQSSYLLTRLISTIILVLTVKNVLPFGMIFATMLVVMETQQFVIIFRLFLSKSVKQWSMLSVRLDAKIILHHVLGLLVVQYQFVQDLTVTKIQPQLQPIITFDKFLETYR